MLGKIYKINGNNCTYIGSTAEPYLSNRLGGHVRNYRKYLNGKYPYVTSFRCFESGEYEITLIESYPCNYKAELQARERYHIELNRDDIVNKIIPGRSQKEYYQDNKETVKIVNKEYQQVNREKIRAYKKEHYQSNKDTIKIYNKEYKQLNKEKISKQQNQIIICECSKKYTYSHKTQHKQSKFHQLYLELCNLCD